jgi:hypothetical protein
MLRLDNERPMDHDLCIIVQSVERARLSSKRGIRSKRIPDHCLQSVPDAR